MSLTRLLCALLGGHALSLPQVKEGRLRLVCQYGCGYQTRGIVTTGMERAKVLPINLMVMRGSAKAARRVA